MGPGHQALLQLQTMAGEAEAFIRACYRELGKTEEETEKRVKDVLAVIDVSGTYVHTSEELAHGAKMAWRNSNKCIGRLFWETLHVLDARSASTEEEMAEALYRHIEFATNGGKIRPAITVFRPAGTDGTGPRIWNAQLVRYAGYETADGIVGDPISVKLTKFCESHGWRGAGSAFDVLPLVLQAGGGGRTPKLFDIPGELVMEVPIRHPELPGFERLALKWYAVPMVSNMRLEIGGLQYTAAPFNGWYMGTEIGARNFADEFRYNMLPKVAELMGLDTRSEFKLWRDRALVELNAAVLHSFREAGVTIVDHHTAAKQFARFEGNERQSGRPVTGEWTWLIPPVSPATTHIFHSSYDRTELKPNYYYQQEMFE